MQQASTFFSDDQRARVENAVAEAESRTSAEIVPVLATASGRYDRPEDIIGLWTGLALMVIVWCLFPRRDTTEVDWGFAWIQYELAALVVAVVLGFVLGAVAGTRIGWLRRLFTPRNQMRDEVAARARQAFFDRSVHHTAGGTGLLVYVSLYERMAAVIADQAVIEKLGQQALDELCGQLTKGLRTGDPTDTLCAVLKNAGDRLGAVLPRAEDDQNELPNRLVILD